MDVGGRTANLQDCRLSEKRHDDFKPGLQAYFILAAAAVLVNISIVANPGFFSHDEWEIHDIVARHGLLAFIEAYGRVYAGSEFGVPVRPLGFIQQGLTSFWMQSAPFVPHAFSVALHAVTTLVFAKVLGSTGIGGRRSLAAALLFAASPLAAFATGWTAACFDQWLALFALLAAGTVVAISDRGFNVLRVVCLMAATAAAILSKETAIALPAAAAILWIVLDLLRGRAVRWWHAGLIGVVAALPVLCYLAVRFPALLGAIHNQSGPYSPSIGLVPQNALMYFAFPFLVTSGEMVGILALPEWQLVAAVALHLLLVAGIVWRFNLLAAGLYLISYFVFLMPVITIPSVGSHYLHTSALCLSLALACLVIAPDGHLRARGMCMLALTGAMLLTLHTFNVQDKLYVDGLCQRDFLTSLDAQMADSLMSNKIVIRPAAKARWWVGKRAVFQRQQYAQVRVIDAVAPDLSNFTMDAACRVIKDAGQRAITTP